ncbi:cytochrome P450 [Aspergillus falconensis]
MSITPLTALSPDAPQTALTFLVLGAALYQCIRHGEIDNRLRPLSALYLPAFLGFIVLQSGLIISIIIYRAFFHRLRHFPGPWTAKVIRISTALQAVERAQYHLDLRAMHRKYGDFIPGAHRCRRRAWDRGFSMKALPTYKPLLQRKVDVLVSQIRSRLDRPLNITQWAMYLAFDVMGLLGFSKDFRQLEDTAEHAAIKELHGQMLILGILKSIPWVLTILGAIQGVVGNYGQFMIYYEDRIAEKKMLYEWTASESKVLKDIILWLIRAIDENDQSAPPGEQALNEDGRLLIITGSDTTGVALANAFYYLTEYAAVYRKLQAELDNAFPSGNQSTQINDDSLRKLPYFEAVINETFRLKPAIPSGQPRQTPPEGLQIDKVWYVIQRDDRCFPSAEEFIPERWLAEEDSLIRHEEAFFPFQLGADCVGRYGCVGKQLALTETRVVIAHIALEFNLTFAPGETGEAFDRDAKDTFTFTVGPLMLDFRPRCR